jgi:hypothetical protein
VELGYGIRLYEFVCFDSRVGWLVLPSIQELSHVVCGMGRWSNLDNSQRRRSRRATLLGQTYRILPTLNRVRLALGNCLLDFWDRQPRLCD